MTTFKEIAKELKEGLRLREFNKKHISLEKMFFEDTDVIFALLQLIIDKLAKEETT